LNQSRYSQFDPDHSDEPELVFHNIADAARFLGVESDDPDELLEKFKDALYGLVNTCTHQAFRSKNRAVRMAIRKYVRAGLESIITEQFGEYKSNLTIMQVIREEIDRTLDDILV
jgi:hypothetical protein